MNTEIQEIIDKYPKEIKDLFLKVRGIIYSIEDLTIKETLYAKLPSYYNGNRFVRIIPFKDHINIECSKLIDYKDNFSNLKFTPKGMLQIKLNQEFDVVALKKAFRNALK